MRKCKSWSFVLRLLITAALFTIFVSIFALPSYNKYLNAGIFIDKSLVKRKKTDTPSVTFCALNNETDLGWKTKTKVKKDLGTTWVDLYCDNKQTVDNTVACLDVVTFNLNETIRDFQLKFLTNIIGTGNELWIHDVTDAYIIGLGEILKKMKIFTWNLRTFR